MLEEGACDMGTLGMYGSKPPSVTKINADWQELRTWGTKNVLWYTLRDDGNNLYNPNDDTEVRKMTQQWSAIRACAAEFWK